MTKLNGVSLVLIVAIRGVLCKTVWTPGTNFLDHLFILWWVLVGALRVPSIGFLEFEMLP